MKVLVIEDFREAGPVRTMFDVMGHENVTELDETDIVCFVGGEDVDPALYNHHAHPSTFINKARDVYEQMIYWKALERGIPMVGICRGGQFLNVMNGGEMYQDVDGHNGGYHEAWIGDAPLPVKVNSVHHQMMIPNYYLTGVQVLLRAKESKDKMQMSRLDSYKNMVHTYPAHKAYPTDCEALFYPDTRCLCYQPHPEYNNHLDKETREVFELFLKKYILSELAVAA